MHVHREKKRRATRNTTKEVVYGRPLKRVVNCFTFNLCLFFLKKKQKTKKNKKTKKQKNKKTKKTKKTQKTQKNRRIKK
jgi:large-conductance mechanosensitive channel